MKRTEKVHPAVDLAESRLKFHARRHLSGARVWLFGSRARGDALRRSDFDLAVEPARQSELERFVDAVRNDPEIIYPVDVVELGSLPAGLRDTIREEGVAWTK